MPSVHIKCDGMANISIRGVDEQSLRRLKQTARKRGISLNRLISEMLNGTADRRAGTSPIEFSDLDALAGSWTAAEGREFEKATAIFGQIDARLWR